MDNQIFSRLQLLFSVGKAILTGRTTVQAEFFNDPAENDDVPPALQHVQPYGLSYWPQDGAQVYGFFVSGDRSLGFALVTGDKRYQVALAKGEVALHDDQGQSIHLTRSGIIVKGGGKPMLFTDTPKITFDAPDVNCSGNMTAALEVSDKAGAHSMSGMRVTYDSHKHPGDSGGTTGTPDASMGGA